MSSTLDFGVTSHRVTSHTIYFGFNVLNNTVIHNIVGGPLIIPAEARSPSGHQEGPKGPEACSPSGQIDLEKAKCLITIRNFWTEFGAFAQIQCQIQPSGHQNPPKRLSQITHPDTKGPKMVKMCPDIKH
jgi:hypothetical protein